jgi:hypothetical protein
MTDLVLYKGNNLISSYDEVERAAKAMAGSGFFTDTRQASQAIVKIMAGAELGVGPFASMVGVNIIQGKPAFGANIMAACVKKSGRYNYRVTEMTDKACTIEFMEKLDGKWLTSGVSSFTIEDARKAGTKNLDKFPRNMLFARAMSNGVRWYCPDVMNGSPAYTPEELGADVDEDGNVVEVVDVQPTREPAPIEIAAGGWVDPLWSETEAKPEPQPELISKSADKPYSELAIPELTVRWNELAKSLKDNHLTDEERADKEARKAEIKRLITAKREGAK